MKISTIFFLILLLGNVFGQFKESNAPIFSDEYLSDKNGNVYMYVNILGHVKNPGTYPIYEGADILSILSQAGGPLPGAKLDKVLLYKNNESNVSIINLDSLFESGESMGIVIKPNDTIYIKESIGSILLSRSITSILQILNILITIAN